MSLWDQLSGKQKAGVFGAGFLVLLGLAAWGSQIQPQGSGLKVEEPSSQPRVPETQHEVEEIQVYIAGAIQRPGVYKVRSDFRVVDVIDLAGGMLPDANELGVNLASPVKDGMQITVPFRGLDLSGPPVQNGGPVSINLGSLKELESLPDVGPVLAEAIIKYREENGPFQSVEDLAYVSGVGEKTLEKLRGQVRL